ncbi:UDP-glucose dehydrogenase family protein [Vibrio sonorensis]|uniref:UDP-glucose dehydrogenase family protein n=1 Tax=Vibrio sonorensis TaxID=1004316 RepID=UPI0008D92577|nr:UDP-glucose/GDP-mannose dehydrogenase family protein [Vibrio sonorensis]
MKVTVFGVGYVGLVQAAVLADAGHNVCCVDTDKAKIENLKSGQVPIYEPDLANLIDKNFRDGHLKFTTCPQEGVDFAELLFIAVGTPPDEDGSADLQYVLNVAETIASLMKNRKIVINKSTVPVGTADKVKVRIEQTLAKRGVQLPFDVASNPEFLKEGVAVADCKRPDRIIIGTDSDEVEHIMRELYEPFNRNHEKILIMDVKSAELTKYAANCMLATKISFMNEMANIAEQMGANIESVRKGIGSDPRIGYQFIYPGCGYGGSCFPKDVQALIKTSQSNGYDPQVIKAVENVNNVQKNKLFTMIEDLYRVANHCAEHPLKGKTIALWGLAFKPNTDDMREAPSRNLIEALWQAGAKVQAYDPKAMEEAQRLYAGQANLLLMGTKESALTGADILVICTEWQNFKAPDFDLIKDKLSLDVFGKPVIVDGRNLFDPVRMHEKGFIYRSIGRPAQDLRLFSK